MNYKELIGVISEITSNEKIIKHGLSLVYELSDKNHKQLDQELFYQLNSSITPFEPSSQFEVEVKGLVVKFIKKETKEN